MQPLTLAYQNASLYSIQSDRFARPGKGRVGWGLGWGAQLEAEIAVCILHILHVHIDLVPVH